MFNTLILLQAAAGSWSTMILVGVMFLIMWLFFIRPQSKKQKDEANFTKDLKLNQKVVTIGGICGIVVGLDDQTLTLSVDQNSKTRLKVQRQSISMEMSKAYDGTSSKK